jgi:RNA 2',3'-cyclic 3'-phosphodiesterase
MPNTSALIRTFVAIELDQTVRDYLLARQRELAAVLPQVRFVAPETWHITLAFIGEIESGTVRATREIARTVAATTASFTLHAAGVGIFGKLPTPKVLWVGISGNETALRDLQQAVASALDKRSIPFDHARFSPHITLARLRRSLQPDESQAVQAIIARADQGPSFQVNAISVMRSDLTPQGAHYTCLEECKLG